MRKTILLSLFLSFIITGIKAQSYFPEGAIWYYNVPAWTFPPNVTYTTIESKGDSIFNNDTLTYIEGQVSCGAGFNELIKQINKKVYKLNPCDSSYSLLYDFNANVGDTLVIYPEFCYNNSDSITIKIDSISSILINGASLKYFHMSQLSFSSFWQFNGNIIEGIGNEISFYPLNGSCDPAGGPLRCYEDTVIGYYNTGLYPSCDTSYTVGIDENEMKYGLTILPNPSINNIKINAQEKITQIELFDIKGTFILSTKQQLINIANLKSGVYFVKVYFDDNVITRKILKE